jgi:hypothetical protein
MKFEYRLCEGDYPTKILSTYPSKKLAEIAEEQFYKANENNTRQCTIRKVGIINA